MKTNYENLILSGAVSLATSVNLEPIFVGQSALAAIQLVYTGTPAGTFKLQASCDKGNINGGQARSSTSQQAGVTNWTDTSTNSGAISAAGSTLFNVADPGYQWLRVVWTASGTGTTPVLTVAQSVVKGV